MQARKLLVVAILLSSLGSILANPVIAAVAGTYEGEYNSTATGSQGKIRIQLREEAGKWSGDMSAFYNGSDLPTRVVKVEVQENKLVLTVNVDAENMILQIILSGNLTGDAWSGTYEAATLSDRSPVDSGSWKATRK